MPGQWRPGFWQATANAGSHHAPPAGTGIPDSHRDDLRLGRSALSHYEMERLAKDERHIPVSLSVFPIRDADSEIVVQHEHVELEPIIDEVIRELAPQIAAKGLRVSCDVPPWIDDHGTAGATDAVPYDGAERTRNGIHFYCLAAHCGILTLDAS